MATLSRADYRNRVYACWLGKNCGGTLGAPLELPFGQAEPFAIDWYPELREGGIPNDDLEMQLIWLKAVEERGFALKARDLAQYWLDHVGYNFDEYGFAKTNLRLGLLPPLSGSFNNWFRDGMGSPIRSEIWACLAPGVPDLAVAYAREDAQVDHAGGEGIWGEIFNTALQSAAFVCIERDQLLEIALSYLPANCGVAHAVRTAMAAHAAGKPWQEARQAVLSATPHTNAQYAPINLGFQTIGWLYGRDFGDALCTAVNCGYDTDCTGATLGALLGILGGRQGIPARWSEPLGDVIATNESWGGVQFVSTGPNPIPTTLADLTERVCALGERLLAMRAAPLLIHTHTTNTTDITPTALRAPQISAPSAEAITYDLASLAVTIAYPAGPAIGVDVQQTFLVSLQHPHPYPLLVTLHCDAPAGWDVVCADSLPVHIPPGEKVTCRYTVQVAHSSAIANTNTLDLTVHAQERPAEQGLPVVFVGARRWQVWAAPLPDTASIDTLLEHLFAPEEDDADLVWEIRSAPDNAVPWHMATPGVLYAQLHLWSPTAHPVHLGFPATSPSKVWLNGQWLATLTSPLPVRPSYAGLNDPAYVDCTLQPGWNTLRVKYIHTASMPDFDAYVTLAETEHPHLHAGITAVRWTQLPWEAAHTEYAAVAVHPRAAAD